jgi:hypothetical protein
MDELIPFQAEHDHTSDVGCCDQPMPAGSLVVIVGDGTAWHADCARHEGYAVRPTSHGETTEAGEARK